jgi:spoIIIJ-associated protein
VSSSEESVETNGATAMNDEAEKPEVDKAEVAEAVVAIEEMVAGAVAADDAEGRKGDDREVGEETASPALAEEETADDADFEEDGRADKALDFVVEVLSKMQMDCTVDLMENDVTDPPSDIRIEISGKDASRLIGKKGQTLAALQFLTNRVVNRPSLPRRHILIDADGYRTRRESALSTMAQRLGQQAVDEGKIITFEPMSAQDRRVVHLALAKFPGVVTKSEGKGATRRVQIIPVRE